MRSVDSIRMALEMSKGLLLGLIDDMKDAPLTFPTPKGGNHPLWVLGHLTYAEGQLVKHFMLGEPNPVMEWGTVFGENTEPVADPKHYPPFEKVRARYEDLRSETMRFLDSLSDSDLDKPSKNAPPALQAYLGTYGQCFLVLALHTMHHRGQVADARRAAGRAPVFM